MKIIYLVHGPEKYFIQARFSILSLLHHLIQDGGSSTIQIAVYTTHPEKLPPHPLIHYRTLENSALESYQGEMNYIHRIKLKVLMRAQADFGLPILYVDCDTQWINSPVAYLSTWESNVHAPVIMHTLEGAVGKSHFPSYLPYLQKYCTWTQEHQMWNAGVIGVPHHSPTFLSETIELCDHMLLHCRPRYWVEQMALSSIAQKKQLATFEPYLLHFWPYGRVLHHAMKKVLDKADGLATVQEQSRLCAEHIFNYALLRRDQDQPIAWLQKWKNKVRSSLRKRRDDVRASILRRSLQ